jgi:hypothetical protein
VAKVAVGGTDGPDFAVGRAEEDVVEETSGFDVVFVDRVDDAAGGGGRTEMVDFEASEEVVGL